MMAFPFVKLFQNNQLVCFEIIATVLGKEFMFLFKYYAMYSVQIFTRI